MAIPAAVITAECHQHLAQLLSHDGLSPVSPVSGRGRNDLAWFQIAAALFVRLDSFFFV